jgi:hypothetical protein
VLYVHLEVVLQVHADGRQIVHHGNAQLRQLGGVAHTGQLQQLRRVERSAAEHDLLGVGRAKFAANLVLHAGGGGAVEQHLVRQRAGDDGEVGALHHRVQVRAGRAEARSRVEARW